MTTTGHMDTRASSLVGTGDHQHMPRRSLLMRGRKALAAPWLLALVMGGAVGACGGPPALTAAVSTTDQRRFSLDNVIGTQEPHAVPGIIQSLEKRPSVFGIDTVAKIQTKLTDAGGVCDRKSG